MTRLGRFGIRCLRSSWLAFAAVVACAGSALAIDATGPWDVTWTPPGGDRICILTQTGTTLWIDCDELIGGPIPLPAFNLLATIDPDTGVFSWVGTSNPEFGCPASELSGVVDAGATSFTGEAHFVSFHPAFGCVTLYTTFTAEASDCGNGTLDAGETCDDGNNVDGDCTCQRFCDDAAGSACDDGVFCNGADHCDDGGVCSVHAGDPCPTGPCVIPCDEDADTCFAAAGTRNCGPCDACRGLGPCVPLPLPSAACKTPTRPRKSTLLVKNLGFGNDKLTWKWRSGAAITTMDLGDPTTTDDYALCVYAGEAPASRVFAAEIRRNTIGFGCADCWRLLGEPAGARGAQFKGNASGIGRVLVKPGLAGKSSATVTAGGTSLSIPSITGGLPMRVQLHNSAGLCLEATFSSPQRYDATVFKATSD